MQDAIGPTNGTSDGFLLLDSHMSPIFVNHAAAQILVYPQQPEKNKDLNGHLAEKIRSVLLSKHPSNGSTLVSRFQSGRRQYVCRSFSSDAPLNGGSQPYLAVILERASTKRTSLCELFEKFHLTAREKEVAQLLERIEDFDPRLLLVFCDRFYYDFCRNQEWIPPVVQTSERRPTRSFAGC